jgi:hypothetical protein
MVHSRTDVPALCAEVRRLSEREKDLAVVFERLTGALRMIADADAQGLERKDLILAAVEALNP